MTAMDLQLERIKNSIKTIPDYPKPGIFFRDITSLLEQPEAYAASIRLLADRYRDKGLTKVVGTEARGFLFGAPVALALGLGFVPVRKPGKLPRETLSESYELEYGVDMLEIHQDAIKPGDKVLVVDDLLATGGTIEATVKLIRRLGGEVHDAAFVINLADLGGEERLKRMAVESYSLVVSPATDSFTHHLSRYSRHSCNVKDDGYISLALRCGAVLAWPPVHRLFATHELSGSCP
ncbi:adenine phosphoribosyltransferase [Sodalis ligni]|nr:adenine phosphoribosyltransferase [Sodalis ligni]